MKHKRTLCLLLPAILASFCNMPEALAQKTKDKSMFSIPAAEKEIELRLRAYENALKNRDSAAMSNLYAADARYLSHGGPSVIGREAIVKSLVEMMRDSITVSGFTTTGLWGDPELLVEEGTGYFAHVNGKVVSRGRYLLVWKKENGVWKIFRDTFFSDGKIQ